MSTKFCLKGQHGILSRSRLLASPTGHPCGSRWAFSHLPSFEGLSIKYKMFLFEINTLYLDLPFSDHKLEGLTSLYDNAKWIQWILLFFCIQPISPIPKQQLVSALHQEVQSSYHTKGPHFYSKHIQNWLDSTVLLLIKTQVSIQAAHLLFSTAWWLIHPLSFPVLERIQGRNNILNSMKSN